MSDCPHCGQRILVRHDAHLSPKLADIFDAIERGTGFKNELAVMFYGDNSRRARQAVAVSINHINRALEWAEASVRILSARGEPYRVVRQ